MAILTQNSLTLCQCMLCCRPDKQSVCSECLKLFPKTLNACLKCASPIAETHICGNCLQKEPSYDYLLSAGPYQSELKSLIKAFKYHEELHWLEPLATLLGQKIDDFYEQCPKPSALLAMPLHPKRIKERGFNQALELANRLARRYQTPLLKNACARLRDTRPQSTLSEKERKKNVSKAFSANAIPFSHIALIDDVVTTGCSISALSKQLKAQNPALRIDVWCLAKA